MNRYVRPKNVLWIIIASLIFIFIYNLLRYFKIVEGMGIYTYQLNSSNPVSRLEVIIKIQLKELTLYDNNDNIIKYGINDNYNRLRYSGGYGNFTIIIDFQTPINISKIRVTSTQTKSLELANNMLYLQDANNNELIGIWLTPEYSPALYQSPDYTAEFNLITPPTTGPQGAQGPQGPQGAKGAQGDAGDAGGKGPQGGQGVPGAKGVVGVSGGQGDIGVQGPKGDKGIQGLKGPTGADGPPGPSGPPGRVIKTGLA